MHFVKALLVASILALAPSWGRADDVVVSANGKSCSQVCKVSNRHAVPVASMVSDWILRHVASLPDQSVGQSATPSEMQALLSEPPPVG